MNKKPYGNVSYADPGYQSDKKKRYPLDTEAHVKAAASYFGMSKNKSKYSTSQQKSISSKIAAAEKKFGVGKKEMAEEITIDAFKAGKYPQGEFGEKELNEIVSTYDPAKHEAPILIGHVSDPSYQGKSSIPAFGWVKAVVKVGDHLKFLSSQFSEELKDLIKRGFYKKVSAAFYEPNDAANPTPGKWHLHHLAFLGGTPPAVKGLEGIAFAEITGNGIEFAEMDVEGIDWEEVEDKSIEMLLADAQECVDEMMSTLKEELLQNAGDEDDDPDYFAQMRSNCFNALYQCYDEITNSLRSHFELRETVNEMEADDESKLSEMAEKLKGLIIHYLPKKLFKNKQEENVDKQKETEYQEKITSLEATVNAFTEKEEKQKAEFAEAQKKTIEAEQTAKDETLKTEIKTFCEAKVKEGKMTPAMREKDEPKMFEIGKANPELLKSFQEKYDVQFVPVGEHVGTTDKNLKPDTRPRVERQADAYVKAHTNEFAELSEADSISRAMYLQSIGKIKFEDIN